MAAQTIIASNVFLLLFNNLRMSSIVSKCFTGIYDGTVSFAYPYHTSTFAPRSNALFARETAVFPELLLVRIRMSSIGSAVAPPIMRMFFSLRSCFPTFITTFATI